MSRLEELIAELCPDGVEYKTLGELGKFYSGLTGKSKADFVDGNAIFITYRNVYSNPALDINPVERVKIGTNERQNILQMGDVIFTGSSETLNECGMSSVLTVNTTEKLYLNSFCFIYRFNNPHLLLPSFSKYLFRSDNLRKKIIKTASGVTRFNVSKTKMSNVTIPLPPLPVQQRIVSILDRFDSLCNNIVEGLPAEITARQKQYEFFRDKLLSFNTQND